MKAILIALAVLLGSCASPAEEQDAAAVLEAQVTEIRAAASNRDRAGAERELAELRSMVEELRRSNDLTEQRASEILDAADQVARYLSLITRQSPTPIRRSPTPSPTPRPTPSPTPEPKVTEPPEPPPPQEPQPAQTSDPPENEENPGNDGQSGVPGT